MNLPNLHYFEKSNTFLGLNFVNLVQKLTDLIKTLIEKLFKQLTDLNRNLQRLIMTNKITQSLLPNLRQNRTILQLRFNQQMLHLIPIVWLGSILLRILPTLFEGLPVLLLDDGWLEHNDELVDEGNALVEDPLSVVIDEKWYLW